MAGKEEEIVAWVRLDDAMPHHPKVMAAGPQGFALDVAGICYSNKHATDGFIPDYALPAVCPSLSSSRKWAGRLVEVGRWVRVDGGWQIHDIGDFQPSAVDQKDLSKKRAEAGRRGGLRSGSSRREASPKQVALTDPNPVPSRPVRDISSTDGLRAFNDQRARDEAKSERDAGGSIRNIHAVATWKAAQTDFAAESARLWAHRDCPTCGGKGHTEEYAPGAGNVKTPCTEVVE
jgi:hypothetical protein